MPAVSASRYRVDATWDDAPHLDEKTKAELLESTPPYMRDARSKGIPALGAGAIYPVAWEDVICDPFPIPAYWPRAYGFDVGWNNTAAIWIAKDPDTNVMYAYSEYKQGKVEPMHHARAIKARGSWIKGAIDPASQGRSPDDGKKLIRTYSQDHGLKLAIADNAVAAGLDYIWTLLQTGMLKYFSTLTLTRAEYIKYRRIQKTNADGVTVTKVLKKDDHIMDAKRYVIRTFDKVAGVRPVEKPKSNRSAVADSKSGY